MSLDRAARREVAIVDPAWDIDGLVRHLAARDYKLVAALATHYHPDHIGGGMRGHNIAGVAELLEKSPVKIYAHKHEADGVKKVTGISDTDMVRVDSGDTLKLGDIEVEFLHTPGHTPGLAVLPHQEHPGIRRYAVHRRLRPRRSAGLGSG